MAKPKTPNNWLEYKPQQNIGSSGKGANTKAEILNYLKQSIIDDLEAGKGKGKAGFREKVAIKLYLLGDTVWGDNLKKSSHNANLQMSLIQNQNGKGLWIEGKVQAFRPTPESRPLFSLPEKDRKEIIDLWVKKNTKEVKKIEKK